jgi:hypothetical protein
MYENDIKKTKEIERKKWLQELESQYIGDTDTTLDYLEILPQELIKVIVEQQINCG